MIPADCLIIESNKTNANEISLTGEFYSVRNDVGILDEKKYSQKEPKIA